MTEMVERVARAISDHDVDCQERGGWQNCDRPQPCSCRLSARAAIAAMREPTDAMLDALLPGCNQEWAAAIDAALVESLPAGTNNG